MKKSYSLAVAWTRKRGIGNGGTLPWPRLNEDMAHFKRITTGLCPTGKINAIVMGRKTWESIPESLRPLRGRYNVILSSQQQFRESLEGVPDTFVCTDFPSALNHLDELTNIHEIHVIGGSQLFSIAMRSLRCSVIYGTEILKDFPCDTFIDVFPDRFELVEESDVHIDKGIPFQFLTYRARDPLQLLSETPPAAAAAPTALTPPSQFSANLEEQQYLDLVADIMATGTAKSDRTGVGTISKFGAQMRFSLRDGRFPLLTTKRVFWRGVAEELFWFVRGGTDARELQARGVHIWDGNGTRAFLDKCGFTDRAEGDLGPVYGFQWRHFGAAYTDSAADYSGQGVDQLQQVIHALKHSPDSRRIIMSAWNPCAIGQMALPPCHVLAQFYVARGELSCQLYQRSCDMGLGVPFNVASYALLTVMLARLVGLRPGEFVHTLGDAHVYQSHVEPLKQQLLRVPKAFPTLRVRDREYKAITDFGLEDFELVGYCPDKGIKMEMAV